MEKPLTLKLLGDNLRNYPLLVACTAGVGLLWNSSHFGAKAAALLWTCWLVWFGMLTVIQSSFLVTAAVLDALDRHAWFKKELRRRRSWLLGLIGVLSAAFFYSSVVVAIALHTALKR